jgi:hypothetical protein
VYGIRRKFGIIPGIIRKVWKVVLRCLMVLSNMAIGPEPPRLTNCFGEEADDRRDMNGIVVRQVVDGTNGIGSVLKFLASFLAKVGAGSDRAAT